MINCKILENGDLKVTAANSSRSELKYERERSGHWGALAESMSPNDDGQNVIRAACGHS